MINRILAVYTSDKSVNPVKAVELAEETGSDLAAVYVIREVMFHDKKFWDQLVRYYQDDGREKLDKLAQKASERGIDVESRIVEGRPAEEILGEVEETGSDLVLIPRNCRGKYEDFLLGSTAKRVVENSEVPVLTLPSARQSPSSNTEGRKRKGGVC